MGWGIFSLALLGAFMLLLVWAGIEDARTRNIGNAKTAAIALLAPAWWFSIGLSPWPGIAIQIGVAAIVFALFCIAFRFNMMGGGDVKLIGAIALWLPPIPLLGMLLLMSIAGGVLTLIMIVERRIRRNDGILEIPYGVAIAFAAIVSLREPLLNHFA